jgi:hypothetical protein
MKIDFEVLATLDRNATVIDVKCHKIKDLSIFAEFKKLQKLKIRTFQGKDLAFLKKLQALKSLVLENVVTENELEDLRNLSGLEELTLQTPVGWDGSGKKLEYKSLKPLSGLESLIELRLLDIMVNDTGFQPVFNLKNLRKIVTNNTFSTYNFAELSAFRSDIECEYATAYRIREIDYFKCKKCGTYKLEFSGIDLPKRTFCPNCNKKKVEELTERFNDIKNKIKAGNIG